MKCQVGDLVIVIRDDDCPLNVGAFLHIEGPCTEQHYHPPLEDDWDCKPLQPVWSTAQRGDKPKHGMDNVGYPDDWLKPIRPQTLSTKTTEREKEFTS